MTTLLITGCASGLGRHLTGAFLRRGDHVLATDLDFDALQGAAAEDGWLTGHRDDSDGARDGTGRCLLRPLDVTAAEDWDAALDALQEDLGPRLDVSLHNAGVLTPAWVHEATPADIDRHLSVNVRGVMLGTRAAARQMLGQEPLEGTTRRAGPGHRGHIVNIASLAGVAAIPGLSHYSASKFAVRGFSLAAAEELAPQGIAVTALCPDAIHTPMLDLQVDYEEAALTFSGSSILSVADVERVLMRRVLPKRPVECLVPASRGWTAKIANLFPRLARPIARRLWKVGEARRRRWQGDDPDAQQSQ